MQKSLHLNKDFVGFCQNKDFMGFCLKFDPLNRFESEEFE